MLGNTIDNLKFIITLDMYLVIVKFTLRQF